MHAIEDMTRTLRTGAPTSMTDGSNQPGTCWTCKSPDVPRVMAEKGVAKYYKANWAAWGSEIVNPIGCADCHDARTMELHISRPALKEAFARQGRDITKASHQEMRSLVCAQCHVEYYLRTTQKLLRKTSTSLSRGIKDSRSRTSRSIMTRRAITTTYTHSQKLLS